MRDARHSATPLCGCNSNDLGADVVERHSIDH